MQRRDLLKGFAAASALTLGKDFIGGAVATPKKEKHMPFVETADGTRLFVKDWGGGRPILFLHSWAMNNEIWQYQHDHFVDAGYRVVAYDRRGHGRSDQPGDGYDSDTLADDLARVLDAKDLHDVTLIGHSMASGEIVRYLTRHGSARIARIALVSPTTPCLLKSPGNPDGIDGAQFEAMRQQWRADFPQWIRENSRPFFLPETSQALIDWAVAETCRTPLKVVLDCNRFMVESDFRPDLRAVRVPALVIRGTADLSAPFELTGRRTAALIPGCALEVYDGAPHGLMFTHRDRLNADLEKFMTGT